MELVGGCWFLGGGWEKGERKNEGNKQSAVIQIPQLLLLELDPVCRLPHVASLKDGQKLCLYAKGLPLILIDACATPVDVPFLCLCHYYREGAKVRYPLLSISLSLKCSAAFKYAEDPRVKLHFPPFKYKQTAE